MFNIRAAKHHAGDRRKNSWRRTEVAGQAEQLAVDKREQEALGTLIAELPDDLVC